MDWFYLVSLKLTADVTYSNGLVITRFGDPFGKAARVLWAVKRVAGLLVSKYRPRSDREVSEWSSRSHTKRPGNASYSRTSGSELWRWNHPVQVRVRNPQYNFGVDRFAKFPMPFFQRKRMRGDGNEENNQDLYEFVVAQFSTVCRNEFCRIEMINIQWVDCDITTFDK